MAESDFSRPCIIGYGCSPSPCGPTAFAERPIHEISRFPRKERLHIPGSLTTRRVVRASRCRAGHVAFHRLHGVGTQDEKTFALQWLAYALPCQRFAEALAGHCA